MNDLRDPGKRLDEQVRSKAHAADALKAYVDGELSGPQSWLMRGHLAHCRPCREESEALKRVSHTLQGLPAPEPRPELRARILASLPETPPVRPAVPLHQPRLALCGAACAALFIGAFALGRASIQGVNTDTAPDAINAPVPPHRAGANGLTRPTRTVPAVPSASDDALPVATVYPSRDPFSKKADEETARQLASERLHAAQNAVDRPLASSGSPFGQGTSSDPIRLAVSTPDSMAANSRLQDMVRRLGGTLTATVATVGAPTPFRALGASGAVPYPIPAGGVVQPGRLLLARLPKSQSAAFKQGLQSLTRELLSPASGGSTASMA